MNPKSLFYRLMLSIPHRLSTAVVFLFAVTVSAQVTWRTDSLMNTWAVKQRMTELGPTLGRGVVRAVDTRDLYDDLRRAAPGIPVFADSNVVLYADLYGEPLREQFRVLLGVSRIYFPIIERELANQDLPAELKYLPMALSAMNNQAGSWDGRAGLWMLTYPVALRYGLAVTRYVDERHDDLRSTAVAGRYLRELHARYQDWGLTVMAFACGPANVTRAQQRAGGATDYRSLYPHFTEGEQEVLPLLMAFIHLSSQAEELGIEPINVMPWEVADTLTADRPLQLHSLAQVMQLPLARLQALNPTLCAGQVPGGHRFYVPRMMAPRYLALTDSIQRLEAALARVAATQPTAEVEELVSVMVEKSIRYQVRSGDHLGSIAAKHRVSVKQLKDWNNLKSDRINAGRTLLIKVRKRELVKPTEPEPQLPDGEAPTNQVPNMEQDTRSVQEPAPPDYITYIVRPGDSLYSIAQRYPGLTAQHLMELNGIGKTIKPGQTLKIQRQ